MTIDTSRWRDGDLCTIRDNKNLFEMFEIAMQSAIYFVMDSKRYGGIYPKRGRIRYDAHRIVINRYDTKRIVMIVSESLPSVRF